MLLQPRLDRELCSTMALGHLSDTATGGKLVEQFLVLSFRPWLSRIARGARRASRARSWIWGVFNHHRDRTDHGRGVTGTGFRKRLSGGGIDPVGQLPHDLPGLVQIHREHFLRGWGIFDLVPRDRGTHHGREPIGPVEGAAVGGRGRLIEEPTG